MSCPSKLRFRFKTHIGLATTLAIIFLGLLSYWATHRTHQIYMPKPIGYCRINLPEQRYQSLTNDFPYRFEYSIHAQLRPPTSKYKMDYWINLYYPDFDATIYLSYQSVRGNHAILRGLCESARILASKHQVQASSIEESIIQTPKGYQVHVIELFGQVPTPFQFYTTDGQKHFLRGALYFKTATQSDFLAPVIAFIKKDIIHMLHTLEWKK
ncbi:gliding motility lipoprotein GldD [Cardinium endosymbiont of Philonthus spinipes]|uniref:gliding motility lipoprotein GldD n=1 Tax=Cardinium endosymbiont of Philonthus spinipes TaxID=3077941 RepID=UPI00313D318E